MINMMLSQSAKEFRQYIHLVYVRVFLYYRWSLFDTGIVIPFLSTEQI